MIERREHLRLALEAREPVRVGGKCRWQDLERDRTVQLGVTGLIHLAHSTGANGSDDVIGAETGAG
jgi:hypothetical protein